ncbi:transposase [Capilliphycus salinus ALCB114379]|uniref:IS110 family transposase n=1 Tax=Capilliphycus salinus TaxID=2768948 RepID=UPI0039A5A303
MKIIGLDVGANHVVAAALESFPQNMQRYYRDHEKEFIKLNFVNGDGFDLLWQMLPDGVVMEPSGRWYSRLVAEKCTEKGIQVYWVGHAQLKAQRESYGFKSKRDREDALSLAACYFDDRFIDVLGRKRFLNFNTKIDQLRDWFYEWEQLIKIRVALVNHIKQRLCYEFPERAEIKISYDQVNKELNCVPFFAALAGIHSYWQFDRAYEKTCGAGISDYTRQHAQWVCENLQQVEVLKAKCLKFIAQPEFKPYLEAMKPFKFGVKNQVGLLVQCYPFDKFLVDGKPWVERRISRSGKRVKCDRSLRQFQAFLGLSYTLEQSGKSGQTKKKFHGSKVCRANLYMWAKTEFDKSRGSRMTSDQGRLLWEKHKQLRRLFPLDAEQTIWQAGEGAIGGDDALIRLLFTATAELYKNLVKMTVG